MVFLEKKKKIFEIVMEYLKLISMYIKSFADSSKKLTAVVIYIYIIYIVAGLLVSRGC